MYVNISDLIVQIFKRILDEVEQRVLEIRKELHEKVIKMPQSVEQQKKFIKALTSLEVRALNDFYIMCNTSKSFVSCNKVEI